MKWEPGRAHVARAAHMLWRRCRYANCRCSRSINRRWRQHRLIIARPILIANGLTAHIGNWRAFVKQKGPPGHANTSLLIVFVVRLAMLRPKRCARRAKRQIALRVNRWAASWWWTRQRKFNCWQTRPLIRLNGVDEFDSWSGAARHSFVSAFGMFGLRTENSRQLQTADTGRSNLGNHVQVHYAAFLNESCYWPVSLWWRAMFHNIFGKKTAIPDDRRHGLSVIIIVAIIAGVWKNGRPVGNFPLFLRWPLIYSVNQ